ncbi:MAG: GHMP kinase [Thermomicrobiaceae bacterium]|nr:GHMP kinase [Thermomicrobiaceae bacterium]
MLIVRAPVRISLAGGGTDLEAYYRVYGGVVINTTIDKYFYVFLKPNLNGSIQLSSSDYGTFYRQSVEEDMLWDGDLALPRAILHHFGIRDGISLFLASEIPPGTGLGSSSSVAVAVIKAISTACGERLSRAEIAELACEIEIKKLGMPIGKQDQYASAFGGLNLIRFRTDGVEVEPLAVSQDVLQRLQRNLLLFFTGSARNSADILRQQRRSSEEQNPQVIQALHAVKAMALEVQDCLVRGDLRRFGELLHESWQQKKRFAANVSTSFVDECYELARSRGALGGKLTGAGGGGFMMLYCEEDAQPAVIAALEERGLRRMDYHFETDGARVLMNSTFTIPRHRVEPVQPATTEGIR